MHGIQESWVSPLGWEDALPCPMGGGHGNPLKYSHLENPMDSGTWQATIHGVIKSPPAQPCPPSPALQPSVVRGWDVGLF